MFVAALRFLLTLLLNMAANAMYQWRNNTTKNKRIDKPVKKDFL